MMYLWIILLAILSGFLYRFGGAAKRGDNWDFLRRSITRDLGCSFLTTLAFAIKFNFQGEVLPYFLHFGLLWIGLSTYWDFLNKEREVWWTWLITGFFYGLAGLSFLFSDGLWELALRCVVLALTTMTWRVAIKWDVAEEFGVGVLVTGSVLI